MSWTAWVTSSPSKVTAAGATAAAGRITALAGKVGPAAQPRGGSWGEGGVITTASEIKGKGNGNGTALPWAEKVQGFQRRPRIAFALAQAVLWSSNCWKKNAGFTALAASPPCSSIRSAMAS